MTVEQARAFSALVVDGDGVSRRFAEVALARHGGMHVETATAAAGALEILAREPVDVIISDIDLPDMPGLGLLRKLGQEPRLADIPFLVFSADAQPETKVVALRAGADDYVTKPCSALEL